MTKRNYWRLLASVALGLFIAGCNSVSGPSGEGYAYDHIYENVEFDMPRVVEPEFPDYAVNIRDFGAEPGGEVKNTQAFEDAIADVVKNGGGKVIVPRGIWLTGPVILKSNVNLHLEAGALMLFSRDFNDYPLVRSSFEGLETYRCISPIYAKDEENIAITGEGIIDGSGDAWRPVKKSKMTKNQWKELLASGGVLNEKGDIWFPSEASLRGHEVSDMNVPEGDHPEDFYKSIKDFLRPVMVNLVNCNKILLDGPTFQNSPAWNIHPLMCENLTVRNLTVRNPWYSQNGDGIDVESCKNVVIYNCNFDVGDDAICFKSGKNEDGRRRGMPTENVIVKNCVVYHGHGGFVVGSEMSGGVRNVHVSNCTFIGTDVGLRFKSTRGRGGIVENIYISNIDMTDIPTEAIRFNLFYGGDSPIDKPLTDQVEAPAETPPVTEETPRFRNIFMKNITCKGAGRAVFLQGLPEMNLENFNLDQVTIEAKKGIACVDAENVNLSNIKLTISEGPALSFYSAKQVKVDGFDSNVIDGRFARVAGASEGIIFTNTEKLEDNTEMIEYTPELAGRNVIEVK